MPTTGPKETRRADYASTRDQADGAWIAHVADGSPAWEAGLEEGMRVLSVNGVELRDIIDWRWEADGELAELEVYVPQEDEVYACDLEREAGRNVLASCVEPAELCMLGRVALRDDDYRLSFLQGNFVTLTNVTDEDVQRIIDCRLEPMNVSLHAISPEVRRSLIGRNAQRGIDVLERLLRAGIEVHGQIVLCAGINDGDELRRTLDWVESWPTFTSLALVPMGYTKYSRRFSSSFSEDREASQAVVRLLRPYQERARRELGITRFQLSDEFYLDANLPVPAADTYDGYPQFYDGIGMLRSFLDDTTSICAERKRDLSKAARWLDDQDRTLFVVCGEAAKGVVDDLCASWASALGLAMPCAEAYPIRNDYYGGDVNVTGLIVSCDLLAQLPKDLHRHVVMLPEVMFNFDHVTLDGDTQEHIVEELASRGAEVLVCVTTPGPLLDALLEVMR